MVVACRYVAKTSSYNFFEHWAVDSVLHVSQHTHIMKDYWDTV